MSSQDFNVNGTPTQTTAGDEPAQSTSSTYQGREWGCCSSVCLGCAMGFAIALIIVNWTYLRGSGGPAIGTFAGCVVGGGALGALASKVNCCSRCRVKKPTEQNASSTNTQQMHSSSVNASSDDTPATPAKPVYSSLYQPPEHDDSGFDDVRDPRDK